MSYSRPFAERSSTFRGMTLVAVMISQAIAIVVISAMMSVVVAMVNKLQSEVATSDAQVNLRQVSHLLLRDTQGVGSSAGSTAGDFVVIQDGGATAPDSFTLFRRDESVCGGSLPVANSVGNVLNIDNVGAACPIPSASCTIADIEGRTMMVLGSNGQAIMMTGHNATGGSSCKVNYPTGLQAGDVVAAYNSAYSPDSPLRPIRPRMVCRVSNKRCPKCAEPRNQYSHESGLTSHLCTRHRCTYSAHARRGRFGLSSHRKRTHCEVHP